MRALKLLFPLLILCLAPVALAQDDCPLIVATAMETVDSVCGETARNQLCYGNITANATPREGVADFQFEQPGDIVRVSDIEALQLSSFGSSDGEWGVALMKLQANLPDAVPGQNVTFLLFGDVSLIDASDPIVALPVTATNGVNVRSRPTTAASVIESLRVGQEVIATGRLDDSSWIRVRLDDTSAGWVSADFLDGELRNLLSAEPGAPVFGPMQAFYFATGLADAPCEEAPDSGILVQTPEGAGSIQLRANDVDIRLGSTLFLQAVPGDALYVYVLEGHATSTAQGQSQVVPAGTVVRVPLDANGVASGPPEYPQPYTHLVVDRLPVTLLPDVIRITSPLSDSEVQAAVVDLVPTDNNTNTAIPGAESQAVSSSGSTPADGLPPSGRWQNTASVLVNTCDPVAIPVGQVSTAYPQLTFSEDRSSLLFDFGPGYLSYTFYRTSDNVYVSVANNGTLVQTMTFTSPTSYLITHRGDYGDPNAGGCTYYQDDSGVFVGN